MGTNIRPTISEKNKYWINKHRYYELKHFCLQYPVWKKAYVAVDDMLIRSAKIKQTSPNTQKDDPTSKYATLKASYWEKIRMVENAALHADEDLHQYILKAVTEELSYNYLKSIMEIPCSKDMYYDRYRKFFWILNKYRD